MTPSWLTGSCQDQVKLGNDEEGQGHGVTPQGRRDTWGCGHGVTSPVWGLQRLWGVAAHRSARPHAARGRAGSLAAVNFPAVGWTPSAGPGCAGFPLCFTSKGQFFLITAPTPLLPQFVWKTLWNRKGLRAPLARFVVIFSF